MARILAKCSLKEVSTEKNRSSAPDPIHGSLWRVGSATLRKVKGKVCLGVGKEGC